MINNSNVLAIPNNFFFFALCILCACSNPTDKIHSEVAENQHHLAVFSILADKDDLFHDSLGIYVEGIGLGQNWQGEKANFFSKRKIPIDLAFFVEGRRVVQQKAKLKVSGGGSRKQPQKSFNLSSKKGFSYPFFEQLTFHHYKSLRLRVSGQDWRETHMRDALMHTLVANTHIDVQAYQPVVLYLNGVYWGIYNLREKFNVAYLRQHHRVNEVDILERNSRLIKGDEQSYLELLNFVSEKDLRNDSSWIWIESQVDLDNFIDYYCAQIYFSNTDWPGNNIKYWKSKGGKWRWFMHDTDLGFAFAPIWGHPGGLEHNTLLFALNDSATTHHNQPWSTLLFRKFMHNAQFKQDFIRKFAQHLEETFHPDKVLKTIDSLAAGIENEMPQHIERWKYDAEYAIQSIEDWQGELEVLRHFARKRPDIVREQLKMVHNKTE